MDFSLHEQRQLAQIERALAGDRRLVALMGVLASDRARRLRLMRCFAVRLRHPWRGAATGAGHRIARLALTVMIVLTVAAPTVVITSLVLGILALTVAVVAAIPVLIVLLVLTHRWVYRYSSR